MKSVLATLLLLISCTQLLAQPRSPLSPSAPTVKPSVQTWTCNAFYLPARSIWQRTVAVEIDASGVRAVQIDGVAVYAFTVQGTSLLTAIDSERIQFDAAAQTWTSDLRGIVSSQGRCDRTE